MSGTLPPGVINLAPKKRPSHLARNIGIISLALAGASVPFGLDYRRWTSVPRASLPEPVTDYCRQKNNPELKVGRSYPEFPSNGQGEILDKIYLNGRSYSRLMFTNDCRRIKEGEIIDSAMIQGTFRSARDGTFDLTPSYPRQDMFAQELSLKFVRPESKVTVIEPDISPGKELCNIGENPLFPTAQPQKETPVPGYENNNHTSHTERPAPNHTTPAPAPTRRPPVFDF
jgi:hypothetical protein